MTASLTTTAQAAELVVTHGDRALVDRYLQGLAPAGRQGAVVALARVARVAGYTVETMPWSSLRAPQVDALRSRLSTLPRSALHDPQAKKQRGPLADRPLAPSTINHTLACIRGVLKCAWLDDQVTTHDYHKATAVRGVKGSTLPAGRDIANTEIAALLRACYADQGPAGLRDAAIIAVMWAGGFRRDEVTRITLADVDANTGRIVVTGKGQKQRVVYVVSALAPLRRWLKTRGNTAGALFSPINKGGRVSVGQGMTSQAIYNALGKRADQAGVGTFSPHDLRRTYVGNALSAGVDISTVAAQCGHASVTTTARYDRRKETALQAASALLALPQ